MKIGCICIVKVSLDSFIAIECSKNRGTIMPGGKWEPGESFMETAERELREETGITGKAVRLVHAGLAEDGYFVYAFQMQVIDSLEMRSSKEGRVVTATWDMLKQSKYRGYYELLQRAWEEFRYEV